MLLSAIIYIVRAHFKAEQMMGFSLVLLFPADTLSSYYWGKRAKFINAPAHGFRLPYATYYACLSYRLSFECMAMAHALEVQYDMRTPGLRI